jgi:hypothetical protein
MGLRGARIIAGSILICSACAGGQPPDPTSTKGITALDVLGPASTLALRGQTLQLTVRVTYSDATVEDVTTRATWSSSAPGVATVSAGGLVTAVASGSTDISARYQTRTATRKVVVDLGDGEDWVFLGGVFADGLTDLTVQDIVVDPRDSDLLYVAANTGVFVSRDRGASWTRASVGNSLGKLAQDPSNPDRVFCGVRNTLWVSGDKGTTWRSVRVFTDFIRSIRVSRLDSRTVYVGLQGPGNSGIFRSTDDGVTWESHAFGYPVSGQTQFIPWDIAEDPVDGTLYVPTELHDHPLPYHPPAFRSIDRGVTWQDVTGSLPWHGTKIVVQPATRQVLFLTEGAGLYSSSDRGLSWGRFGNASFGLDLEIDPNRLTRFFGGDTPFGGRPGGVFLSDDGARTFTAYGLGGRTCGSLAVSGDSSLLYAACYNAGIFVRRLP